MMTTIIPVLMSGGSGTRLWPLSRTLYPKQLLPLTGADSMMVETARRLSGPGFTDPMIIGNEAHRFVVAEQLRAANIEASAIVLEPVGRNTAPAAAIAALIAAEKNPAALLLLAASDHSVTRPEVLRDVVLKAAPVASEGRLVTIGITPTGPETGYGYIRRGSPLTAAVDSIDRFVEKPDLATAEAYLAEGTYLWNAGIFLFRADAMIREMETYRPDILAACRQALAEARRDLDFLRLDPEAFGACPSESIDYAVMEKSKLGAVIPADPGWSDVGAWNALWEIGAKDTGGNVVQGDVMIEDVGNSYIRSDGPLTAVVGVTDLVVVATSDAVLVAPREQAQEVKKIVDRLKKAKRSEAEAHDISYRPWGTSTVLVNSTRYRVNLLVIRPGHRLSLQLHRHRAEHWTVTHGTADITVGGVTEIVSENGSMDGPMGVPHRIANNGKLPLHVIEVQTGSYLGEDDITRLEDDYGRA
jgi:mannose-1-phosphate guanylyltransferase/mannose-6-phosphate isomerase